MPWAPDVGRDKEESFGSPPRLTCARNQCPCPSASDEVAMPFLIGQSFKMQVEHGDRKTRLQASDWCFSGGGLDTNANSLRSSLKAEAPGSKSPGLPLLG